MTTKNTERKSWKEKDAGGGSRGLVFYLHQRTGNARKDKP